VNFPFGERWDHQLVIRIEPCEFLAGRKGYPSFDHYR
jgi:hypothetical protein